MRLIDADLLIERLGFYNTPQEREENAGQIITLEDFDEMPTAYDVDAVVEQLDEYITKIAGRKSALYQTVMQIVKGGGVDAN